jgi:hypothetical protein
MVSVVNAPFSMRHRATQSVSVVKSFCAKAQVQSSKKISNRFMVSPYAAGS